MLKLLNTQTSFLHFNKTFKHFLKHNFITQSDDGTVILFHSAFLVWYSVSSF